MLQAMPVTFSRIGFRHADAVALVVFAVAVRLLLLPLASQDSNDHSLRLWISQRWIEDPFFFLHGHWPPLHFFLIGPVIGLTGDMFVAPVLVHVALSSLVPAVLYAFTLREFGDRRAAIAVGAAFALYPIAIRTSLEMLAQPPFSLAMALTLLALSHARDASSDWRSAAGAGLILTVATLIRVEGWLLIPFLGLTLLPRLAHVAVFCVAASIGPLAMMAANVLHYGDPLLPITTVVDFELGLAGREHFTMLEQAGQVADFVVLVVSGMTPVLALCCGLGGLSCVLRRRPQWIWLIPAAGLTGILLTSVARGSTAPKAIYTETLGLLWIPFLAACLTSPTLAGTRFLAPRVILFGVFGTMLAQLVIGTARDIPEWRAASWVLAAIPSPGPAPTFHGKPAMDELIPTLRQRADDPGAGLVIDALGTPQSYYLGWQSGYHPDRIYLPSGAPNADLDYLPPPEQQPLRNRVQPLRDSEPLALDRFLRRYCSGLLVLQPGSRFAEWLGYTAPGRAAFKGVDLTLERITGVPWATPDDPRLRDPDVPADRPGEAIVFTYRASPCDG